MPVWWETTYGARFVTLSINIQAITENLSILREHLNVSQQLISILHLLCILIHFWSYFVMLNVVT